MNRILPFLFILSLTSAKAQTELKALFASSIPTRMPANITVQSSSGAMAGLSHSLTLDNAKDWHIQADILFTYNRYIMDGMFSNSNGYEFSGTPSNFKQNELNFYSFRLPVLLKYSLLRADDSNNPLVTVGVGPYVEYVFASNQKYKADNQLHKNSIAIQNPVQYGLGFDMGIYGNKLSNRWGKLSLHTGIQYQISDYLKDAQSFKPIMGYVGLGFRLK
ncbi:MAG: outer membrane beta-barrel protein [Edaphocola sp.]